MNPAQTLLNSQV